MARRSALLVVLLSSWSAACAPHRPPPARAERTSVAWAGSSAAEPPLGSMSMALHLFAAPPPSSILAKVGLGHPERLLYPSPRRIVGRVFGSGRSGCHLALDMAARMGDPVFAAEAGYVAYVGPFQTGGQVVMLVHAGGWVTVYAHLSSALVRPGDTVQRGQTIARAGSTGNSQGPHLHFVLLIDGHPVDPLPVLDPRPTYVAGSRRFASPERAAAVWRRCPAKGRRYEQRP